MIDWLQNLDTSLFRFINLSLSNPLFDSVMPFLSGNKFFVPAVIAIVGLLIWKGGKRGRICALVFLAAVAIADGAVCNTLKHAIGRLRPFNVIADAHVLVGRSGSGSMPSSHAANWFAATMVCFLYYRRSWRFMLPMAVLVSFSRIYNGVHYPSDVLIGAVLGAATGAGTALLLDRGWQNIGRRWFPLWWVKLPFLLRPDAKVDESRVGQTMSHSQWMRLGYILIGVLFLVRFWYIGSGKIELSEDEAYQWIWSKHPALSYFSKPPLIAYTQWLGTHIWGDIERGVRFFSPVIAAALGVLLLRFIAREINAKVAFVFLLIVTTTPLMGVGATLMTIDPLSVLFWVAAMIAGWRAAQPEGTTRQWLWVGVWMGLGFLSKYTALVQLICWVVFFALWRPARAHLRRPGPYLALLITIICSLPVLIWNSQHDWITVEHVANNGRLHEEWKPTLRFFFDFLGAEFGLLNPVFFVGAVWAAIAFWRNSRTKPLFVYLFSMGAPVFIGYLILSFRSRILPNWIAPSVLPLFCLMVLYWHDRWTSDSRWIRRWLISGLVLGSCIVVLAHESGLIGKLSGRTLPARADILRRVRGWRALAEVVAAEHQKLEAQGTPVFIIGDHYGITAEITFYWPKAKNQVQTDPLVYYRATSHPENQFYFWPSYEKRTGQTAIFVRELQLPKFSKGWISRWLKGSDDLYSPPQDTPQELPKALLEHFDSITELGIREARWRGDCVMRRVQLFECRNFH